MHQRYSIECIMKNFLLFYYQNRYLSVLFVIYWIVIFAKCHVHCGTYVALPIFQCLTGCLTGVCVICNTVYHLLDKLLCKLNGSGLGCRIGNFYVGALSYADDITLLCPSIRGLNKMLDICNSFADMYDIKFIDKKSLGIKFGCQQVISEVLYLSKSRIEWVSSVKQLSNYVNSDMTDKTDCDMKCSSFIGYVYKLKANFGFLQPFVLGNLFKAFCFFLWLPTVGI